MAAVESVKWELPSHVWDNWLECFKCLIALRGECVSLRNMVYTLGWLSSNASQNALLAHTVKL